VWTRLLHVFAFFMFTSATPAATAGHSAMEPGIVGFFLNFRSANKLGRREYQWQHAVRIRKKDLLVRGIKRSHGHQTLTVTTRLLLVARSESSTQLIRSRRRRRPRQSSRPPWVLFPVASGRLKETELNNRIADWRARMSARVGAPHG
jgi:hypothetical protein